MTLTLLIKTTIVLGAALAGAWMGRRGRAALRHVVLASAFAMLALLPIAAVVVPSIRVTVPAALQPAASDVGDVFSSADEPAGTALPSAAASAAVPARATPDWSLPPLIDVLTMFWIAGSIVLLFPVAFGLAQVRALRRSAQPWRGGQQLIDDLRLSAGRVRRIDVLLQPSLPGPMTCGLIRPAILLPADAKTWAPADLRRALVHELEHVRRLDWGTQCLALTVAAVYWFHPLVWIARRRIVLEAERACDDAVLSGTDRAEADADTAYADQLVTLARRLARGPAHIHLAMANRRDLSARISAVLDRGMPRGRASRAAVCVVASLALIGTATISPLTLVAGPEHSASQKTAKFEVASIRPCTDEPPPAAGNGRQGGSSTQTISADRIVLPCLTVDRLIATAYVLNGEPLVNNLPTDPADGRYQWIKGLPDWARTEKFTIEGKAGGPTDARTLRGPMLAALLEQRFKLTLHRDSDEQAVYALTVVKSGLKIKPEKCVSLEETTRPADAAYTEYVLSGGRPNCTTFTMALGKLPGTRRWVLGGETMAKFAGVLSGALDRRVIDRTGLTDEYTIRLEFFPDEHTRGRTVAQAGGDVPPDASGPNMFAALEAQLGLKLEPAKAPRGLIIVDAIERPRPDKAITASFADFPPLSDGSAPQSPQPGQRFEVAAIRPCTDEQDLQPGRARGAAGGTNAAVSPGRFTVPCVTLEQLVYLAYASYGARETERLANDYLGTPSDSMKVRGGPDWVHSSRSKWAIEATAPGVTDRYILMGTMLRSLLEDRFKLRLRRASETVPMYALKVAKGGTKVKPIKQEDCAEQPVDLTNPPAGKLRCGFMTNSSGALSRIHFEGFELSSLARRLSDDVQMHVIDETGITDKFVIELVFRSDSVIVGPDTPAEVANAPTLKTALEQQLGLTLEKTTGARGYLVIEYAEKPSPGAPIPSRARPAGR